MSKKTGTSKVKSRVPAPPIIINNDDGNIFISDSEPLGNTPDSNWTHPINCTIVVNRLTGGADNTFKATVVATSKTSKNISHFEFDDINDTLNIELDETPLDTPQLFTISPITFKAINNAPTLIVNVSKKKKKVGRVVHTISYSNIKLGISERLAAKKAAQKKAIKTPAKKQAVKRK